MNFNELNTDAPFVNLIGPVEFESKAIITLPLMVLNGSYDTIDLEVSHKKILKQIQNQVETGICYVGFYDKGINPSLNSWVCKVMDVKVVTINNERVLLGRLMFLNNKDAELVKKALLNKNKRVQFAPAFLRRAISTPFFAFFEVTI